MPAAPNASDNARTASAPVGLAEFRERLPRALIALDFDGTVSPIVRDPGRARPVDGAHQALQRLAAAGATIAVVTGRDARTAVELSGFGTIDGLVVSGLHGAELWQGGRLTTQDEPEGMAALRAELPPLLSEVDPGIWLEDKRLSLVVHTRRAAEPEAALLAVRQEVTERASRSGLQVVDGKFVLEIRIPGLSKADAIAELLTGDITAALFAGDDHGDLPAFEAVHAWSRRTGNPGIAVAVGDVDEVRRAADIQLAEPADLAALLAGLS